MTDVKLTQKLNALPEMNRMLLGIVIEVKPVQELKAPPLIKVKLLGDSNVTDVKPVQFENAHALIVVTLLGMLREVMVVKCLKPRSAICVTGNPL
jgi:hypothetical protein